ncbi:MAG: hypothetical protein M9899_03810 [Bdellovibrionaceae bacterium]|nr:hypothetical protein [Pseudobdellovibrionaceae bacterium]
MTIEFYLNEVEFAATKILHAIWHEHSEYKKMNKELGELFQKTTSEYEKKQAVAHQKNNPFILYSWWNNSEELKILFDRNDKLDLLKRRIRARMFAVNVLAGNLLQIAKQGISITHGDSQNCPDGRQIGSQTLKSIIWHGRNQSLHWEEGKLRPEAVNCFKNLCREHGLAQFGMFKSQNLGFAVINILGWRTFENFKSDMLLLDKIDEACLPKDIIPI